MKSYILFIFLLFIFYYATAQEKPYVLFNADSLHTPVKVDSFELYYNEANIQSKTVSDLSLRLYDLYFTRFHFRPAATDQKNFYKALSNFNILTSDILAVLTPLYNHSSEAKWIDVTDSVKSGKITFLSYQAVLRKAVQNLYSVSFSDDNLCGDSLIKPVGRTKRLDMQLVVKKQGRYYRSDNYILMEFYYISMMPVIFPNELTYGEINVPSDFVYFTPAYIMDTIANKGRRFINSWEHFKMMTFGRTYCAGSNELSDSRLMLYNYWTVSVDHQQKFYKPRWPGDPFPIRNGSNRFQFIKRIGLVNGNYEFYLNDLLRKVKTELDDFAPLHYDFRIDSVNNMPLPEFTKWYEKKYSSKKSF